MGVDLETKDIIRDLFTNAVIDVQHMNHNKELNYEKVVSYVVDLEKKVLTILED